MVWIDDSIIIGTSNGYSLFSCITRQTGIIFSLPDVSSPPRLKLLLKDWKVLLLVDNVGVIVDGHGQPVGGSLVLRRGLESVAEISLYVAVVRDGKMDLYHKKTGKSFQTVMFAGEGGGPCLVADEDNRNGNLLVVATPSKIFCYVKVPPEEQIKDLLRKTNFKEAVSLVEELECEGEMFKDMLSFVHAQVGLLLLFDLHFEEAVDHFLQSEIMQPAEVFPFIMRDPNRWSLLEIAASEASKILEEASDQDLVLQHFSWIADIIQVLAVKILTSDKREEQLSPGDVLAAIDRKKVEIRQRYLQWLIEDQDSSDTQFHTLYAISLAKSALQSLGVENKSAVSDNGNLGEISTYESVKDSIFESPVRERLQIFLESSDLYDPMQVLELVETSELWLEKVTAILHFIHFTFFFQVLIIVLKYRRAYKQVDGPHPIQHLNS